MGINPKKVAESQLLQANIPKDYWESDFKNFKGSEEAMRITKIYLKTLDNLKDKGIGLMYAGPPGTGKTSLATISLKYVLRAGWSCYMITLSDLIENIKRSWSEPKQDFEIVEHCKEVDFLFIDDVGKEYSGSTGFSQITFDNLIRHRVQNRKITFLTTNLTRRQIKETYGDALLSLVEGKCRIITVNGTDVRKEILKPEVEAHI